jgi:uncharacterized damage-inducible protein DinB
MTTTLHDHLARMFRAMIWAEGEILEALRAHSDPEALRLFAHVLAAEHIWLARLEGRVPRYEVWPALTLADCEALAAENAAGYNAYLAGHPDLSVSISYRTSRGDAWTTTVLDMLTQVVLHGPYHRGQIAQALARAGVSPPGTDFIFFARQNAPATPE